MNVDFHMHTGFSADTDVAPEAMIEQAIALGLKTICVTDHEDYDFPKEGGTFEVDAKAYLSKMRQLQETYKKQLEILIGVEVGIQPHTGDYNSRFVSKSPFDFVIGSVHAIEGLDPYYGQYFIGKTDAEAYRRAFEETLVDIKNNPDFDVLGHIDYVIRYGKEKERAYSYHEYADVIDEILKTLIHNGKGLELNTAGWKYGLSFAHPHPDILKRYRELGGEILTVGSDGHRPEHIAYDFHRVNDLLKGCGFKYYTEFRQRKPYFCALP